MRILRESWNQSSADTEAQLYCLLDTVTRTLCGLRSTFNPPSKYCYNHQFNNMPHLRHKQTREGQRLHPARKWWRQSSNQGSLVSHSRHLTHYSAFSCDGTWQYICRCNKLNKHLLNVCLCWLKFICRETILQVQPLVSQGLKFN